jgi:circadian clock protein KaiC
MTDEFAVDPVSPTGIAGLDEILKGGLPENRLYLLRGAPGVGKTTIALQYLLKGEELGERSLYIALSETRGEITCVAQSHGWSIGQLSIFELSALEQQLAEEEQNTVFHPADIELNKTTHLLLQRIQEVKPRRLVLDSLSELRLMSDTALRYRRQMLSLKQFFAGQQMTVLLLDDHSTEGGDLHVQSIAHGVVTLEQVVTDYGAEKRRIKVNKMRGVGFLGGYHDAMIVRGGVKVFPRLIAAEHQRDFVREAVESGIAELDALVGGGLHRGTSALLLGPAGTGKSTIALQFAVAAARRSDKVLICLFEESCDTMKARAASVGLKVDDLIESDAIRVMQVDPAEMTPGEFVHLVMEQVKSRDIQIVIIDSINGYLQAMPDVKFLIIQLHELLSFLSRFGVLTLMTVAQHGLVGQMQTPIDLTYLADSVILLRYFEQGGRIKKAVSVIKKRIGKHEDTIREFKIDSGGLRLGEPLAEFQGVLTGNPTFHGKSNQMMPERPTGAVSL